MQVESHTSFFSLAFSLFLLMDAIGNIPLFIMALQHLPLGCQKRIIFRELVIALSVILLFAFSGERLLSFLHIDQPTLFIAGGVMLFLIALRMLFPPAPVFASATKVKEPFIVPLAIPAVAGPSVLAAALIYSKESPRFLLGLAVAAAWAASTALLLAAPYLARVLGERGIEACERLAGLLLTLIATQMFLNGITLLAHTL